MAQAASTYLGEQRRRSSRLEQTSPLIIRGVDLLGQPFEERTATQNLSFQGCRYASKHHLPKNTWVTLEAPSGDSRGDAVCVRARVAWIQRPRTLRELFQVGVELEKPRNIWNVEFPPSDWSSEKTPELSIVRPHSIDEERLESEKEASLEDYLRRAAIPKIQEPSRLESSEWNEASITLTGELRHEFLRQSTGTRMFYENLLKDWEGNRAAVQQEISSSVEQGVAAQLASFRQEMKDTIASEWAEKFGRAELVLSQWQSEAQALRNEVRADVEANLVRSDERLGEKLAAIRQELESFLSAKAAEQTAVKGDKEQTNFAAASVVEFDSAREQWNELVENSIESAARRFSERVTSSSREVLRNSEHILACHAADMQKEAGIATEATRIALDEMKNALERDISAARSALKQIEQSASTYTEYSRQLEAASHDALDDLRGKLTSVVAQKLEEIQHRSAELEVKFAEHADLILSQLIRDVVSRNRQEIDANAATVLERIKTAMENFAASEEAAENIFQIHRERLRQFAEQIQREGAARLSSDLRLFEKDLDEQRNKKLEQWSEQLRADAARAQEEGFKALGMQIESQLGEAGKRLEERAEESIDSARERMNTEMNAAAGNFQTEIGITQANQLEKATEQWAAAAQGQVEYATVEFRKAAEAAASVLGEMIVEVDGEALAKFSLEIEERAELTRAALISAGESVLQNIQTHAQTSFEHFQEQLAIKADLSVQKASDTLSRELAMKTETFRAESERIVAEWRTKQESSFAQAFEKNREAMEIAANSMMEAALGHLREDGRKHVSVASEAAEQAVRQACADAFASMAQKMRGHVTGPEGNSSSQVVHVEQHGSHQSSAR